MSRASSGCSTTTSKSSTTFPTVSDDKAQFGAYFAGAIGAFESMSFVFRQPSCRVLDETAGIVNAYDSFTGVAKDGKVLMLHGRTTLIVGKRSGQWKIVSAHFSPLPNAS